MNAHTSMYVRPVPNALAYLRMGLLKPRRPVSGQPSESFL